MKYAFLLFFAIKQFFASIIDSEDYKCKTQLLQFYGLGGVAHPIHYDTLRQQMNNDFCPGIEYSCCTREDFQLTISMWDKSSDNLKRYLTKLFKVVQKTSLLQGSLINLAGTLRENQNKACQEIDFTFFNSAIKYDEVYFYIQNALEAFAFMQKGFYCTICDAKQHQYLGIDTDPARRVAVINDKFCNDLIFFFREFIMFKVYFLDPLVKNANYLFNCYEGVEDKYHFNRHYNATYYNMEACTERGEHCEYLCKEFKFGSTSELFIGSLKDYFSFFTKLQEVVQTFEGKVHEDLDDEFFIDEREFSEEFFADENVVNESQTYFLLKDFNMTNWEINVEPRGINLFDIAVHSNYFLTDANTRNVMKKNYGLEIPGDTNQSTANKLDKGDQISKQLYNERNPTVEKYKIEDDWLKKHEQAKMYQNPNVPTKTELAALEVKRDELEDKFVSNMWSDEGTEGQGRDESDFRAVKHIPKNSETDFASAMTLPIKLGLLLLLMKLF